MRLAALILAVALVTSASPFAQSTFRRQTTMSIQEELDRLPTYGVFDFLAFGVDRGKVTLTGYTYNGSLKSQAARAVKRISGVDEVANKIENLPSSSFDDQIRWATFYRIYGDEFLSRYAPGGFTGGVRCRFSVPPVSGTAALRHVSHPHHRQERPHDALRHGRQRDG